MVRPITLIILLIVSMATFGQQATINFKRINTREGLSQNDIRFIHQDRYGFIWIGTYDGLNRYDGYQFKVFRKKVDDNEGLGSNLVSCIAEDSYGNLWIGTDDNGIYFFNSATEKFKSFKNDQHNDTLLTSNHIVKLFLEKDRYLWAGTPFGLDRILVDSLRSGVPKVRHFLQQKNNNSFHNSHRVWDIEGDKFSNIWIAIPDGLLRFVAGESFDKGGQFITYHTGRINNKKPLVDMTVGKNGLYLADGGITYLAYDQLNNVNPRFEHLSDIPCTNIMEDRNGDLWCGTNDGLVIVKMKDNKEVSVITCKNNWMDDHSISKNIVTEVFQDQSDIIWIGTNGGGVNIYNPFQKQFRHYRKTENPHSLSYNKIRGIFEDRFGNVWIGTEGGGLNVMPFGKKNNYENGFEHLAIQQEDRGENFAFAINEVVLDDDRSMIWVAGGVPNSLQVITVRKGQPGTDFKLKKLPGMKNAAMSLCPDGKGNIWVGTYGEGLFRFRVLKSGKIVQDRHYVADGDKPGSLSSNIVRSICLDYDRNLWIGTDNGLNKLVSGEQLRKDAHFIVYTHKANQPGSLSHDYILPIFQSRSGDLWIGTMGGGLNKRIKGKKDDDDTFQVFTVETGLPNNTIKAIVEDDEQELWISSNHGISRYNPRTGTIKNYDVNDGLQDNEFSEMAAWKRHNGELIFGGVNGFNVFEPSSILEDKHDIPVALTGLQVLNKEVQIGEEINGRVILSRSINETKEIKLKYAERSFTIYFAGTHYGAPAKNMYSYRLKGFDDDWINVGAETRAARYTNLSPGTYEFVVRASNRNGIWSSHPAKLNIVVITPFWQTKMALLVYAVLLSLVLWFFRRYSVIAIREKNALMIEHFEKKKIEELSKMKLRFFTNISHEFRTPLTLIIGPLEKLVHQTRTFAAKELQQQYHVMYRNARILLNLINQLMEFRKLEQGKMKLKVRKMNVVEWMGNISDSFYEHAKNRNIRFLFEHHVSSSLHWIDAEKVERILFNLLSNAFKYTDDGGEISLELRDGATKGQLEISIRDTGRGISEEQLQHLFERFYQAESKNPHGTTGTGIGLSFVKGLVDLHKGTIRCSSKFGVGTVFTILLPTDAEVYDAEEKLGEGEMINRPLNNIEWLDHDVIEKDKPLPDPAESAEKAVILVVEDNRDISTFIKESLEDKYSVHVAANGSEGWDKCEQLNPSLVVSDVMMPVMDGFALCQKIKTTEATSHIPVLLLTAKDTKEDQVKGYEFGADGYIPKPFNMEVLSAQIAGHLEMRKRFYEKFKATLTLEPTNEEITSIDQRFLDRLMKVIEENIADPEFTVEKLVREMGMSQVVLNKKLKAIINQTARAFIRSVRLKRAAQLLAKGRYSIADVTYEVGFNDLKYFRDCFKKEFSVTPSEYLKQQSVQIDK